MRMMKTLMLAGMLAVLFATSVRAQSVGDYERFRIGDYAMPNGEQTVTFTIRLLKTRGWDIINMSSLVLPQGFVLPDGTVLAQPTAVVDIYVRFAPIPVESTPVIPLPTAPQCLDYDPQTPGVQGPFPGATCSNGGWS